LVVNPVGLYRGFMRGRRSKNLFSTQFTDEILTHRVGEYRQLLDLESVPEKPTVNDKLIFVTWVVVSVAAYLVAIAPVWLTLALIALWVLWG